MTKEEKEILFKATDEAWRGTRDVRERQRRDRPESLQDVQKRVCGALYDLCDKLGVRKEYMDYTAQQQK